ARCRRHRRDGAGRPGTRLRAGRRRPPRLCEDLQQCDARRRGHEVARSGRKSGQEARMDAASAASRTRPWLLGLAGGAGALLFWSMMASWLEGGGGAISRLPPPLAVAAELLDYARGDLWR